MFSQLPYVQSALESHHHPDKNTPIRLSAQTILIADLSHNAYSNLRLLYAKYRLQLFRPFFRTSK